VILLFLYYNASRIIYILHVIFCLLSRPLIKHHTGSETMRVRGHYIELNRPNDAGTRRAVTLHPSRHTVIDQNDVSSFVRKVYARPTY
jgi:hypothetical protein